MKIGCWEQGEFIGVILFGDGANNQMFKPYGLDYTAGAELVRIALRAHRTSVTRIVKIALSMLKQCCPGLRLVVSFADPEQGHVGGIYQAGNWLYLGMTDAADEFMVSGTRMHGRAIRATLSHKRMTTKGTTLERARLILDPSAYKVSGSRKHRYLMPLDAAMREKLLPLAKPYPKRAQGVAGCTAVAQTARGGSSPTCALVSAD